MKKYEKVTIKYDDDLLNDFTSKDPTRIWSASCAIRHLYNRKQLLALSEYVEDIIHATKGVDLGGGFCKSSTHLDFAIRKLKYIKDDGGCLCHLYPEDEWYKPDEEEKYGNVLITGKVAAKEGYPDDLLCKCFHCNQTFKVRFFESHYIYYVWEKHN